MRVILHADDCGLSRGISEDILRCLKRGPLASTTLMTGGEYAAEAADALNAMPGVRTALHLNLLEGRSTAPPASVAPLVNANGFFRHSPGGLCAALSLSPPRRKKALLSAIRTEFSAQADWFLARLRPAGRDAPPQNREAGSRATGEECRRGLSPRPGKLAADATEDESLQRSPPPVSGHGDPLRPGATGEEALQNSPGGSGRRASVRRPLLLDGHLHIHALPLLKDAAYGFIREYRPEYVRLPSEPRHLPPAPPRLLLAGGLRRELLAVWATSLCGFLDAEGIGHNRFLSGVFAGGRLTLPRLRASLEAVRRAMTGPEIRPGRSGEDHGEHGSPSGFGDGILEIMCHPGGLGSGETGAMVRPAFRAFYLSPARAAEKAMLLSPELPALLAAMGFVQEVDCPLPEGRPEQAQGRT
jgi:predicted glycoside hydrolase/deacetylase ChbG (UPF0249 family)